MDAQNLNITTADRTAESVAEDVKTADTPWMTKEEVQQKTDAELLQMIQRAQGHTGKDFTAHMGCDFSYSYLTGLLRDRGYENGWHKTSEGYHAHPINSISFHGYPNIYFKDIRM